MPSLDDSITRSINALAGHPAIDALMVHASTWGIPILILAVVAQWWAGSDRTQRRHVLLAAGLSFSLALAINQLVLLFVHRVRPYDAGVTRLLIERSTDPSFPSDHTTAAVAIAAAFFLDRSPKRGLAFAIAAAIISFSRVYLGTHYVSDVLGGALTGTAAAVIAAALFRRGTNLDRALTGIL